MAFGERRQLKMFRPALYFDMLMEENVIEIRNLTKKFGNFTAVDNISFDVRKGEIFGFLGANGAGKTTAMRIVCGLSRPTSGEGTVAGYDINTGQEKIKRHIGYMSQKFSLYPDLTVRENIRLFGGISIALIHGPEIIFLDEPTGGVDPETRRRFWEMIYDTAEKGVTVFVTTHYMDEAEYCDRVSVMVDGKIAAMDSPAGLKSGYHARNMDDVFRIIAGRAEREE